MTPRGRKIAVVVAAALMGCWYGWHLGVRPLMARPLERMGKIPSFEAAAANIEGEQSLSRDDLLGRPWVANFIFTRCAGPCPMLTTRMAALQDGLPEEAALVSFTVDPTRDDVARLGRYARRFGAKTPRWFFARLETKELYELVYAGFKLPVYTDPKAESGQRVTHTTKLVLIDAAGQIRGYYDGADEKSLARIRRDVDLLRKEAGSV